MDLSKLRVGVEEMLVSDSFVVDIEGFSHLRERETNNANSRTNISSNHSRKGTARGGDKKMSPTAAAVQASSRACLNGVSTPEKPVVVAHEASDHVASPTIHQITIKKGSLGTPPPESKHDGKGFGFRRSSSGRFIDSRRVVVFFATLSSMGTVLLIYLTLSIAQLNGDDNGLN